MQTTDYLSIYDMDQGTAKPEIIRKIMDAGESVGPELAYELTGKPDQHLGIKQALRLAGCTDAKHQ